MNNKFNNTEKQKIYWYKWYLLVLLFLIIQLIFYYLITVYFKN